VGLVEAIAVPQYPHAHTVTPRGERVQRNESPHRGICVYGGYAVDGVIASVQDIPSDTIQYDIILLV